VDSDLAVHERRLEPAAPFSVAVRLFLLGAELAAADAEAAFDLEELLRLGWLETSGDGVRATLKLTAMPGCSISAATIR
jgi:hypothetical protein